MEILDGCRKYVKMVDPNYFGIVYEASKKLAIHAAVERLELETFVNSERSYNKEKNTKRTLEDRNKVVKSGMFVGLLGFLEHCESHIYICQLQYTTYHNTFSTGERSTEEEIESNTNMVLARESGRVKRKANITKDCLMHTSFNEL